MHPMAATSRPALPIQRCVFGILCLVDSHFSNKDDITSVAFSSDVKLVAAGSYKSMIIWDLPLSCPAICTDGNDHKKTSEH